MRLGEQEEHDRWDARDQLRPVLNQAVRAFLGEESKDDDLLYHLLVQDKVTEILAIIKENLGNKDSSLTGNVDMMELIPLVLATKKQLREERDGAVRAVSGSVLGDGFVIDDFVDKMMQNKKIIRLAPLTSKTDCYAELMQLMGNER